MPIFTRNCERERGEGGGGGRAVKAGSTPSDRVSRIVARGDDVMVRRDNVVRPTINNNLRHKKPMRFIQATLLLGLHAKRRGRETLES